MMRCAYNSPQVLQLMQGTGGGISTVAQNVGCVDCGATIVLLEMLALAADQLSKVHSSNNIYGRALAYQLDSINNKELDDKLCNKLKSTKKGGDATIFLYTLPKCLLRNPWYNLLPVM